MPTHIALLRGINVGGRNKVSMADLRQVFASLGHTGVATYVQSGNVVFTPGAGPARKNEEYAAALEQAIAAATGVAPKVVVLSAEELAQVIAANPFPDEPNPKCVHAVFFGGEPGPGAHARVGEAQQQVAERGSRDRAQVKGKTLYLHTPDGFGRSDLANLLLARSRAVGAEGTARNWSTVTKLAALCRS